MIYHRFGLPRSGFPSGRLLIAGKSGNKSPHSKFRTPQGGRPGRSQLVSLFYASWHLKFHLKLLLTCFPEMLSSRIMPTPVGKNRAVHAGNPAPGRKQKRREFFHKEGLTMLVLSRRRGEVITIGNGVTITVLAVQGERVKIGITAPAEVPVHRQEIHERIGGCSPELARAK